MIKLNSLLAVLLVLCALALITSQHKARRMFSELAQEQDVARQIDVEWGQLQLEQSTWAMHARIERIASNRLQMRVPVPARTRLVFTEGYTAAGSEGHVNAADAARQAGARAARPARPEVKR